MKKNFFFIFIFIFLKMNSEAKAESRSNLFLRAYVRPTSSTKIKQSELSATKSLWLISNQINYRFSSEEQKIEVEGLNQTGLESHIKKIVGLDRTVQIEILIDRLKFSAFSNKKIFLKITAN